MTFSYRQDVPTHLLINISDLAYNRVMLIPGERFKDTPIMSLQTGSELARVTKPIINPYNLKILAFEIEGPLLDQRPSLLMVADIREVGSLGIIVDSVDELVAPSDVVKLKEIYELGFDLINIQVVDERNHKVGKVVGYTLKAGDFAIYQLRVKRPVLKSLGDTELLIHRSQIVKITNDTITVKSPTIRKTQALDQATQAFENPFRQKTTQPTAEISID